MRQFLVALCVTAILAKANGKNCVTNFTDASGLFTSKNFPEEYDSDTDCDWNIKVPYGRVKLTFHLLNTEHNYNCIWDWIKIFDSDGSLIKMACGYLQQDLILYSTGNSMKVQLKSDNSLNAAGFLASWETVQYEQNEQKTDQSYVLSFPQSFSVGKDSGPGQVCLQTLKLKSKGEVTISVHNKNEIVSGASTLKKTLQVTPGDEKFNCFSLKLNDNFKESKYAVIKVEGNINGYKILSYKSVRVLQSKPMGLIQTDKYDYRPNQDVFVRLMFINEDLRPASIDKVDEIWIQGPSGSRYHQVKDLPLKQGLAQFQYKLSEEPEQGQWKIQAKFGVNATQELKVNFEVNEAVLPTFEVLLETPKAILKGSTKETIKVCAKYTHGANIKGQANVTVSTTYAVANIWRAPKTAHTFYRLVDIDGCGEVTFNETEVETLLQKDSPWDVHVTVKEFATGEKQTAEEKGIKIETKPFTISAGTSPRSHILSAFPYAGQFKFMDHNNKPKAGAIINVCARLYRSLTDVRNYVTKITNAIYNYDEEQFYALGQKLIALKENEICGHLKTNDQGVLKVAINFENVEVPRDVTKLRIHLEPLKFNEAELTKPELDFDVTLTHTNATSGLILQHDTSELECGSNKIKVFVSGKPNDEVEVSHFAAAAGAMVDFGSKKVKIGEYNHAEDYIRHDAKHLKFPAKAESRQGEDMPILQMHTIDLNIPGNVSTLNKIKFLAYTRDPESGDTLSTSEEFAVASCSQFKSSMKFSQETVKPGQPIGITLNGEGGGYCGYSIVDKSVALTANPNKVTEAKIKKLRDAIAVYKIVNDRVRGEKCQDASLLFKSFERLGLFIMSDNLITDTLCDTLVDVTEQEKERLSKPVEPPTPNREQNIPRPSGGGHTPDSASNFQPILPDIMPPPDYEDSIEYRPDYPRPEDELFFDKRPNPEEELLEAPTIDLRSYFPETWLFDLVDLNGRGMYQSQLTAPHTITTWVGEAFCTSKESGLSVADQATFKVDQDFFVDMRVPYGIKRDEMMSLNVTAFNKLTQTQLPLKVELVQSSDYKVGNSYEKYICLDPSDSQTSVFQLRMKELNEVNITVRATIESNGGCVAARRTVGFQDTIQKPVQVRPEGFPIEKVNSEFLCRKSRDAESRIDLGQISFKNQDLVEGSARAWVAVSGDILAPSMNNLDGLVKMPYGCGEQNMISMVPNIYVVSYLKATGQNKPELVAKATGFMQKGYERQQTNFRHTDGSYSIWGPRDEEHEGSMWLTAFVVKSFAKASPYIDIDTYKLLESQRWLNARQDEYSGCYQPKGFTHYASYKSELSLTASLVISMTEAHEALPTNDELEVINERPRILGLKCLESKMDSYTDIYTKSLVAYAYALQKGTKYIEKAKNLMNEMMREKEQKEQKIYWRANPDVSYITSKDVETTAYNVLTMTKLDMASEALKAIKWLATQRNGQGGFKSTQDTMVALQAMSEYSEQFSRDNNDLQVIVNANDDSFNFDVSEDNKLLLQMEKMDIDESKINPVQAKVKGQGCFMVQSILRYNVKTSPDQTSFDLRVTQEQDKIKVCSTYTGSNAKTNMVVIEIEHLSGFEPTKDAMEDLKNVKMIKKVEYDGKTNVLALYYNDMPKHKSCHEFEVKEVDKVTDRKPAIAKIYDYYDQRDILSIEYNL